MSRDTLKEIAALAERMRSKAGAELSLRAACYAIPLHNHAGFNHLEFWPGGLDDYRPGERGDDLRIAAAYLLLEIERLEAPAEKAA